MDIINLIVFLAVGALVGWLAGIIVKGKGFGVIGNIVVGIALALGSVWTLIPAAVATIISVIRTVLEDQTLQEALPGYPDYAQRVRYRLIPGIY